VFAVDLYITYLLCNKTPVTDLLLLTYIGCHRNVLL